MENQTHTGAALLQPRLVRHLGSRLNTRKHAENFAGNTHTATIKGEGIYGAGKSPNEARERLAVNLEREGRLHLYLPNSARTRDGLPPLSRMPAGTRYVRPTFITRTGNGYRETVDQFDTWGEARAMLAEYRLSDPSATFSLSRREIV